MGSPRPQGPRNHSSPAARREEPGRAAAASMASVEQAAQLQREKSAKLRALRLARDAAAKPK
jgi:hypothetical protein